MAKVTEPVAVTETRNEVVDAAIAAANAAEALVFALRKLDIVLNPVDQFGQALMDSIGVGGSGPGREVEAVRRLISDLRFDREVVARIEDRAANVVRIVNNVTF